MRQVHNLLHRLRGFRLALLALAGFALAGPALAHPYHTSFAEIDWSQDKNRLEVSLRVLPEDLETALTWRRGEPVVLGQNHADSDIAGYLREHFEVFNPQGEVQPLQFIGIEVAYDESWLYFQISADPSQRLSLRNTLLMEVDAGQTNRVQALWAPPEAALVLTRNAPEQTLWEVQ